MTNSGYVQEKSPDEHDKNPLCLGPNPTLENVAPTTHLLNFHRKLQKKDIKRG